MKTIEWLLQFVLFLVIVMVVWYVGPDLESRFRPVYSHFAIDQIYADPDGTRVRFRYTKYRYCDPVGFTFFAGDPNNSFQPLIVEALDGLQPPKPLGNQVSNLYKVRGVTPEQFRMNVFGVISNRCHGLWTTRTVIYP